MNWRRGWVFASIHLAIGLGLIVWQEAGYRSRLEASSTPPRAVYQDAAFQTDQFTIKEEPNTVTFDCRYLWYHMPLQQRIINTFELPAALVTGWNEPCPVRWTISKKLGLDSIPRTRSKEICSAAILLILIATQWVVIGGFPLINSRTWYLEAGSCVTVCLVFMSVIAVFESLLEAIHFRWIEGAMLVPGMLGLLATALGYFAWLWWFLLLLWKPVHLAWQSTLPRLRRLS